MSSSLTLAQRRCARRLRYEHDFVLDIQDQSSAQQPLQQHAKSTKDVTNITSVGSPVTTTSSTRSEHARAPVLCSSDGSANPPIIMPQLLHPTTSPYIALFYPRHHRQSVLLADYVANQSLVLYHRLQSGPINASAEYRPIERQDVLTKLKTVLQITIDVLCSDETARTTSNMWWAVTNDSTTSSG